MRRVAATAAVSIVCFASLTAAETESRRFDERTESIAEDLNRTPGLLPWIYEAAGGREEVVRPGSILGPVGLDRPYGEGFDPNQNIHGWGGLAPLGELSDSPFALDLYGRNGTLFSVPHRTAPADTPLTVLRWGRGRFSGNALDLEFRRPLLDSVLFDLQVLSIDARSSPEWEYQNAAHQPFLSTLGRDSSSIPFTGRALTIDTWEFAPRIKWVLPRGSVTLFALFGSNSSSEPPRLAPVVNERDPYGPLTWNREPFESERETSMWGAEVQLPFSDYFEIESRFRSADRSTVQKNLTPYVWLNNPFDTLYRTTGTEDRFDEQLLGGRTVVRSPTPVVSEVPFPELRLDWEFRKSDRYPSLPGKRSLPVLEEDRELGLAEWKPSVGPVKAELAGGWHRISTPADSQFWFPAAAAVIRANYRGFFAEAAGQQRTFYPDWEERYLFSTGRLRFPNDTLRPQLTRSAETNGSWKFGPIQIEGGARWEEAEEWIGPAGAEVLSLGIDSTISDTLAFGQKNWEQAETFRWHWGGALQLGNWNFGIRRYLTPNAEAVGSGGPFALVHLPLRHYAGHIIWKRKVLKEKNLDLSIRWDWHWIGKRLDWELDPDINRAIRTELDEWLALNFEARMRILDFELFYRIRNMNHDQYMTGVGYTPAGINFQYGITWLLKG